MDLKKLQKLLEEKGAKWTAEDNHITAMDVVSRKRLLGNALPDEPAAFKAADLAVPADLPSSIDWRTARGYSVVNPPRDQGHCGSCVGFAITSVMESRCGLEFGPPMYTFSVADAFFCSSHGATCHGWHADSAFYANQARGITQEQSFPYPTAFPDDDILKQPPSCQPQANRSENAFKYNDVIPGIVGAMNTKVALYYYGPITASFKVYEDFYHYRDGIYEHTSGEYEGGHCVSVIGYCDDASVSGGGYWICKNSWSERWGMGGYFNIAYGQCKIDEYPKVGVSGIQKPSYIYS